MPPLLPNAFQERGNHFSPNDPRDLQTTPSTPRPLPFFPTGALLCPPGSSWLWRQLQTLSSVLVKLAILILPVHGIREVFLLCNPLGAAFYLLSLSLSFSSLWDQGSLPSAATTILFSLESCLCISHLPWCGYFSPSRSVSCSLGIQINSWVFGIWYLPSCVRGTKQA